MYLHYIVSQSYLRKHNKYVYKLVYFSHTNNLPSRGGGHSKQSDGVNVHTR